MAAVFIAIGGKMENRFRFRCWNPVNNTMLYDIEVDDAFGEYLETPYLSMMQCTGLKDKNGTLIYEGDIVCIHPLHDQNYQLTYNGVVEWSPYEGEYCVRISDMDEYRITVTWDGQVLGNIYEHPHLLEPSSISKNTPTPPDLAPEPRSKPNTGQGSD